MIRADSPSRHCVIGFEPAPSEGDKEAITRCMLQAGAAEINFTGKKCTIRYPFPELTRNVIYRMMSSSDTGTGVKPVIRLYDKLMAFWEDNERSHLVHTGGWMHYVQDVYIHYYKRDRIERDDVRKQTWRKYKET